MSFNLLTAPYYGWWSTHSGGSDTLALSSTNYGAFAIIPPVTSNIVAVRIYASALTGTPTVSDFRCAVCPDSSGSPGVASSEVNCAVLPIVGWNNFTGLSVAATRGTRIWIRFRSNAGSDYATIRVPKQQYWPIPGGYDGYPNFSYKQSNDSGSTWAANYIVGGCTIRVEFADGSFTGFPLQAEYRADDAGTPHAQGANEVGCKITTPSVQLKAKGIVFRAMKNSSPSGELRYRLYEGTSLIATTDTMAPALLSGSDSRPVPLLFASTQTLSASTTYRVVAGATGADTGGNWYGVDQYLFDTDSSSLPLLPFQGTSARTSFNGTTWTDAAGYAVPFAFILDDPPFGSAGGSSNVKLYQQMGGVG